MIYDLCFAWNWEYDADFAALLAAACLQQKVSLLQVTPANLGEMLQAILAGDLGCRVFFDRASDDDPAFLPLVEWAHQHDILRVNGYHRSRRAHNKAANHFNLIQAGLNTPYGMILPAYAEQPEIPEDDLGPLGMPFTIKPAHGGGGIGVITGATSWEQVLSARLEYPDDQYLLQAQVDPILLEGRPAWFRVIFCTGQVYPFWWDTRTHVYGLVSEEQAHQFGLHPLWKLAASIANIVDLELFSTEIAITPCGEYTVVDFVNDPMDLRLQSKTADGIPDGVVAGLAGRLAEFVRQTGSVIPR